MNTDHIVKIKTVVVLKRNDGDIRPTVNRRLAIKTLEKDTLPQYFI